MSKDKRKCARAGIICKVRLIFGERLLVLDSYTHNLSSGGMRAVLDEKLHAPVPLELELFIAGETNPLKCSGEVRWIREVGPVGKEPHLIDTGIEFTQMQHSDREALGRLADNIISQEESFKS